MAERNQIWKPSPSEDRWGTEVSSVRYFYTYEDAQRWVKEFREWRDSFKHSVSVGVLEERLRQMQIFNVEVSTSDEGGISVSREGKWVLCIQKDGTCETRSTQENLEVEEVLTMAQCLGLVGEFANA